jgi:hypothetical protein
MDVPAFVSKFLSYRAGAGVPRSFALHRTDDGFTHAFFLGATQTSAAQDLFVASAPPPAQQPLSVADEGLPWAPLVQLPDDFDPVCAFLCLGGFESVRQRLMVLVRVFPIFAIDRTRPCRSRSS